MSAHQNGRRVTVGLIQGEGYGAPASLDVAANLAYNLRLIDRCLEQHRPDVVLLPELFTTPYFCSSHDARFFSLAEPIPGPSTAALAERARAYGCYIFAPLFEKVIEGEYYDSCALLGPDGELVPARLPGGGTLPCARKVHLASIEARGTRTDEKYWFRPGQGLTIFDTRFGRFGCLVCYDRSFPEAWRTLVLQGAEAIFIPVVSYGFREEMFIAELRTRAMENAVFAAAANRGGKEALDFEVTCFGNSCIIDPYGGIIARGGSGTGPEIVVGEINLDEISRARTSLPLIRDRRPEVYRL